ncbi:MAG: hypothetical protein RR227_06485, partial [Oscillospiraceae bacterium]
VPVRFVAEALDAWVGYSDLYNTAQIYSDVLPAKEITRLHSYVDLSHEDYALAYFKNPSPTSPEDWLKRNPQIVCFDGACGFNNANEWALREGNTNSSAKEYTFKGERTGKTFKEGVNDTVEYARLAMNEAIAGVEHQFSKDGLVDVKFLTDLSCVFCSKHDGRGNCLVRGVLLIHIPENADISAIQSKYRLGDIKAGQVYKSDIEATVFAGSLSAMDLIYFDRFATLHA